MGIADTIYSKLPVFAQNMACTAYSWRESRKRFGGSFERRLKWLAETDRWSLEQLKEYQNDQLRKIVHLAYKEVPFYRSWFDDAGVHPSEIAEADDLRRLPVLSKSLFRDNLELFRNPNFKKSDLAFGRTSGSTGTPMSFQYTMDCLQFQWALWWRLRRRFGIEREHRQASFGGKLMVPFEQERPPFWRESYGANRTTFSQYHMRPELLWHYVEHLNRTNFDYFSGYPSAIYLLASYIEESGAKLTRPPRMVFTGGENLLDYQREMIERSIAPVTDHWGSAEHSANATRCECDVYHVDMEFGVVEVMELEGQPSEEGEVVGRMLITGLANPAMPLIRYDVGDVVTAAPGHKCACGRRSPVFKKIDGRVESYIVTRDGRRIGRLGRIVWGSPWIREAQAVQDKPGEMVLKVVCRKEPTPADKSALMSQCAKLLGRDMVVVLILVEEIPRTSSGKLRLVVSNIGVNKQQGA